jgi:hypothetical protein
LIITMAAVRWAAVAVLILVVAGGAAAHTHRHAPKLDPEFARVTCGSNIKLTHQPSGYKVRACPRGEGAGRR